MLGLKPKATKEEHNNGAGAAVPSITTNTRLK